MYRGDIPVFGFSVSSDRGAEIDRLYEAIWRLFIHVNPLSRVKQSYHLAGVVALQQDAIVASQALVATG